MITENQLWGAPRIHGELLKLGFNVAQSTVAKYGRIYDAVVTRRLRAMGILDKPIAPASPWQNGFAERLIGSSRRECLDHVIVSDEGHLRRNPISYAAYYNVSRTHRSLNKDAPLHRAIERLGAVVSRPVLGGLHHQYCGI
jgi:hypothetical protein